MNIRPAIIKDYPELIEFGRRFHQVTDYTEVPFCEDSAIRWYDLMRESGILLVAVSKDRLIGVAGGLLSPFLLNDAYLAGSELLWWVDPEFRGGSAAIKLLKGIENEARIRGAHRWSMAALASSMPDKVGRIYERSGYTLSEYAYSKVL